MQNFYGERPQANNVQKNAPNEDESRCANGIKLKWHQNEIIVQLAWSPGWPMRPPTKPEPKEMAKENICRVASRCSSF